MTDRLTSTLKTAAAGFLFSVQFLLLPSAASGATVPTTPASGEIIDPRTVEFDPSMDHDATLPDGTPSVKRYELEFYYAGALDPFQVVDLGKPSPEFDGKIRVDFLGYLMSWPQAGMTYEAKVNAVGPGGSSDSLRSPAFSYQGPCAYVLSEGGLAVSPAGGGANLSVRSGKDCVWMANSSADWLAVQSDITSGSGTLTVAAAPNPTANERTATVTVADVTTTVTQAGSSAVPALASRETRSAPRDQNPGTTPAGRADSGKLVAAPVSVQSTPVRRAERVSPTEVLQTERATAIRSAVQAPTLALPMSRGNGAAARPSIRVSATTIAPGQLLTVTVANGPANRTDWVGLYAVGDDTDGAASVTWQYLSGAMTPPAEGVADSTLTFAMPSTPGTYKVQLLQGDSYTVLATSMDVVITSQPASSR
jgi:all-beta uncharacterized protein